jgi:hypothetical protein
MPRKPHLVASSTVLGLAQLVHLGDTLLELDILALLVAVALVLEGVKHGCVSEFMHLWRRGKERSKGVPGSASAGCVTGLVGERTVHFHGAYHVSRRHWLSGMSRWAQESR